MTYDEIDAYTADQIRENVEAETYKQFIEPFPHKLEQKALKHLQEMCRPLNLYEFICLIVGLNPTRGTVEHYYKYQSVKNEFHRRAIQLNGQIFDEIDTYDVQTFSDPFGDKTTALKCTFMGVKPYGQTELKIEGKTPSNDDTVQVKIDQLLDFSFPKEAYRAFMEKYGITFYHDYDEAQSKGSILDDFERIHKEAEEAAEWQLKPRASDPKEQAAPKSVFPNGVSVDLIMHCLDQKSPDYLGNLDVVMRLIRDIHQGLLDAPQAKLQGGKTKLLEGKAKEHETNIRREMELKGINAGKRADICRRVAIPDEWHKQK